LEISASEKAIARHLEAVFGTRPRIFIHRENETDDFYVGIARVENYPVAGTVTLSTIGVSNGPIYRDDGSIYEATRVEFIASCLADHADDCGEALFRAAAYVGKVRGFACPGLFLHNLFGEFRPASPVPHALLTSPFAYEGLGQPADFAGRVVSWLQVLPVSASEIAYAQARSTDALETLFEARDIDWDSLDRPPAV